MNRTIVSLIALVAVLFVSGCSTIEPPKHYGNTPLASMKSAYVVLGPSVNTTIAEYLQIGLANHGVKAKIGALRDKPADAAFYVTYQDRWTWDITTYLCSLKVQFLNNSTGQTIATGSFKNGVWHNFPDPRVVAVGVIDSMYSTNSIK